MKLTREQRAEVCRRNGRMSKGPKNPNKTPLRKRNPELFEKRFWSRTRSVESGCIIWTGAKFKHGYGRVNSGGKFLKAHRIAWELHNKTTIPEGLMILHSCDNPPCCNPDHLSPGTALQNTRDMYDRGRDNHERGEARYCAKMNEEKVREIRASGESVSALAKHYRVNPGTISNIRTRKRWRHVK